MRIDPNTGWCERAIHYPSPNCDSRPIDTSIDALILHSISLPPGEYHPSRSVEEHPVSRFFCNKLAIDEHLFYQEIQHLKVSSHFFLRRDGSLVQFVSIFDRAWHAGESYALQSTGLNNNSIGIELEGFDESSDAYTDEQYVALRKLIKAIQTAAPAIGNSIFAHSDIAVGRKTDPGPYFDWSEISTALRTD